MVLPKRCTTSTRNAAWCPKEARTRMCAPEHGSTSGRDAQRAARAARQHECVLCEATRWRGACRRGPLATVLFRTRRDSAAVCITPHYVDGWQHGAAVWAAWLRRRPWTAATRDSIVRDAALAVRARSRRHLSASAPTQLSRAAGMLGSRRNDSGSAAASAQPSSPKVSRSRRSSFAAGCVAACTACRRAIDTCV